MKFVLASWGSRGDVEPNLAVGSELVRRGHDVCMAVPPDLVAFTEAAGVAAVGFGPEAQSILDSHREFWTCFFSHPWRIRDLIRSRIDIAGPLLRGWQEMSTTLISLADGVGTVFGSSAGRHTQQSQPIAKARPGGRGSFAGGCGRSFVHGGGDLG